MITKPWIWIQIGSNSMYFDPQYWYFHTSTKYCADELSKISEVGFRPFEGDLDSILTFFQSEAGSDSCLVRTSIFSFKFSLHFSTLFQQIVIIWAGSTSFIIIPRSEIRYSCWSTVIYFNFYSEHNYSESGIQENRHLFKNCTGIHFYIQ